MSLLSGLFEHKGSDVLSREQASFFIRDAQNTTMEMGKLLQQLADAGIPGHGRELSRLLQLNAQVGNTLNQVRNSLK